MRLQKYNSCKMSRTHFLEEIIPPPPPCSNQSLKTLAWNLNESAVQVVGESFGVSFEELSKGLNLSDFTHKNGFFEQLSL